jgi:hypothetical protein
MYLWTWATEGEGDELSFDTGLEEIEDWQNAKIVCPIMFIIGCLFLSTWFWIDTGVQWGDYLVAGIATMPAMLMFVFTFIWFVISRPVVVEKVNGQWQQKGGSQLKIVKEDGEWRYKL